MLNLVEDEKTFISGYVQFSTKREKLASWKSIRKEYGNAVKIIIKEDHLTYSLKAPRNLI